MPKPPTDLAELQRELDAASAHANRLWSAAADPCRAPASGGWSVAQCLSHLAISTTVYLPIWRDAFREPAALPGLHEPRALRLDVWGRFLYWFLEPPPKIRFATKTGFEVPSSSTALPDFLASQEELSSFVAQSAGCAIDRVRIRSAYDSRVLYSVWSSFVTTLAHQRRHLWQAERSLRD